MANVNIIRSNLELAHKVVEFLALEFIDKERYKIMQSKVCTFSTDLRGQNANKFVQLGFFSILECTLFLSEENETVSYGRTIDETFKALEEKNLIYSVDKMASNFTAKRFRLNGEIVADFYRRDLIFNIIFGFEYIIEKYRNSVLKIEHITKEKDHHVGTGFIIRYNSNLLLITNKHVIEGNHKLNVYDYNDNIVKIDKPYLHAIKDLAVIPILEWDIKNSILSLNTEIKILDDIITIGFPSIPMTRFSYQVYHKGEINSFVKDYAGNHLFLISAKTSAGNSGSPVINEKGTVVGIITEELFEKEQFYEKGKLPYYGAISSDDIISVLKEYVL